ncbi:AraC family transcriptional regulator [Myroides sp. WP-1]|uniref:helix-turn-helix domain-containing protein n=1 Tax=Myroides sp. WP-1 TaxID=2759944 RepID=UPI0015F96815|nr:helix-turn-helix domain-containing protein [Myroides sp. WP-1]MBB1138151.1 AraC family transcriptional regulator [Myroides sp. WP-1]
MDKLSIEHFHHRETNNLYINCKNLNELIQERGETIFEPHKLSFYCIQLFSKGKGRYTVDFNSLAIHEQQVLIISKNQIGQFNKPIDYESNVLIFTEDFFCIDELHFQFFYTTDLFNLSAQLAVLTVERHFEELKLLFDLIKRELDKANYIKKQQVLNNYLFNVLLLLEDCIDQSELKKLNVSHERHVVSSFKALVNNKLDKSISIKDYAAELNLNVRTIQNAFKKVENRTPYDWICERIIMEIKRCLLYKNITINEISIFLGFKEPNHLTVFFKKQTGMTPVYFKNNFKH